MIDVLNDDTLCCIFSLLKPNSLYFTICKKIYNIRKQYLLMHYCNSHNAMFSTEIYFHKHRDPMIDYLLRCYTNRLEKDLGHYRKYVLNFISNKNRHTTVYQCKNDYHRLLVHRFCDIQGLSHETVETGVKGKNICQYCQSVNMIIIKEDDGYDTSFYVRCDDCRHTYRTSNYPEHKLLFPHKHIKITK